MYHEFPRALPANTWYSTEPYIDENVRKDRFERIVLELHRRNFDVGAWAARVIEDVQKNRDVNRSGPAKRSANSSEPEAVRTSDTANPAPIEAATQPGADAVATPEEPAKRKMSEGVGSMKEGQIADKSALEFNPDARGAAYVFRAGSSLPEDKLHYFRSYLYLAEFGGEMFGIEPPAFEEAFGKKHRKKQADRLGSIDMRENVHVYYALTKAATPELLDSIGDYNIVQYDGLMYGLPQAIPVNPNEFRRQQAKKTGIRLTLKDHAKMLYRTARSMWRSRFKRGPAAADGAAAPVNNPTLYPLDVRWGEDNIPAFPGVVTAKTYAEIANMVEKITGARRRGVIGGEGADACTTDGNLLNIIPISEVLTKAVPHLVGSLEGYNIVEYEGYYYGIPQSLGNIELDKVDVIENRAIIRDLSRDVVEGEIKEVLRQQAAAATPAAAA